MPLWHRGYDTFGNFKQNVSYALHGWSLTKGTAKNSADVVSTEFSYGAGSRTRTGDLRITNALLYQLSHTSIINYIIISEFCGVVNNFFKKNFFVQKELKFYK